MWLELQPLSKSFHLNQMMLSNVGIRVWGSGCEGGLGRSVWGFYLVCELLPSLVHILENVLSSSDEVIIFFIKMSNFTKANQFC